LLLGAAMGIQWVKWAKARRGAGITAIVLSCTACTTVYAPPLRSHHGGAPGRLAPGEFQAAGSINQAKTGGPVISIPVHETPLHLELGSELNVFADRDRWAMGFAGLRGTHSFRRDAKGRRGPGAAIDWELGGGLGFGGVDTREAMPLRWDQRRAGGAYGGFGAGGFALDWLAFWFRSRLQVTGATDVPATAWSSSLLGTELDAGPFAVHGGIGLWGYANAVQTVGPAFLAEGGLALHSDLGLGD
jgi:hypothetical protein